MPDTNPALPVSHTCDQPEKLVLVCLDKLVESGEIAASRSLDQMGVASCDRVVGTVGGLVRGSPACWGVLVLQARRAPPDRRDGGFGAACNLARDPR